MTAVAPSAAPALEQRSEHRYRVTLAGLLDTEAAESLDRLELPPSTREVVVDLLQVTRCTPEARQVLVRVQERWRRRGYRTAWLSDRPAIRGAALWVMHQAHDTNGKAVGSIVQADRWLRAGGTRTQLSLATLGVRRNA
jgi:anti-anti-sigma regulatory factor